MSFLQELKNKKHCLKHTDTVVTHADGRQFIENRERIVAIAGRQCGFVIDEKPDDIPGRVTDNIYLGSQDCCESSVLSKYNITKVLSIGIRPTFTFSNITYKYVECLDLPETNIVDVLKEHCIPFIQAAVAEDECILIHCNAGVSRSSAVAIGFLMLENKLEYSVAYGLVKSARDSIKPNSGFVEQLKKME